MVNGLLDAYDVMHCSYVATLVWQQRMEWIAVSSTGPKDGLGVHVRCGRPSDAADPMAESLTSLDLVLRLPSIPRSTHKASRAYILLQHAQRHTPFLCEATRRLGCNSSLLNPCSRVLITTL